MHTHTQRKHKKEERNRIPEREVGGRGREAHILPPFTFMIGVMKVAPEPGVRGRRHAAGPFSTAYAGPAVAGCAGGGGYARCTTVGSAAGRTDTVLPATIRGVGGVGVVRVGEAAVPGRYVDHAVLVRLVHRYRPDRARCSCQRGGGSGGDVSFRTGRWRTFAGLPGDRCDGEKEKGRKTEVDVNRSVEVARGDREGIDVKYATGHRKLDD